jgi:hypothetical protein
VADQPDTEPGVGDARAALGAVPLGAGELLVQGQHLPQERSILLGQPWLTTRSLALVLVLVDKFWSVLTRPSMVGLGVSFR